jgi:hypothetical protein
VARIKSFTRPTGGATIIGSSAKGDGSKERTIFGRPNDAGSHSDGGEVRAESSHL